MSESSIAVIILAAGASTRMGAPKQLLPFNGVSLLRHAAQTALATHCHSVTVVLGAQRALLQAELEDLPVQLVENPHWAEGMSASLRTGLTAVPASCTGALLMLCDQPLITPSMLDEMIALFAATKPLAVAAEYAGSLGVPALFSRALFAELLALQGATGAKQILQRHADNVARLSLPAAICDVDTPSDYQQLVQAASTIA